MEKYCQSCGMLLEHEVKEKMGTEANGKRSIKYCRSCYYRGKFTDPEITYQEMLILGRQRISKSNSGTLMKFMLKLAYPSQLKKIERWRD